MVTPITSACGNRSRPAFSALNSHVGGAIRALIDESIRTPELAEALRLHIVLPFTGPLMEVLRRAAVRGQIPAAALTPRITMVGPDLLLAHVITHGPAVPEAAVVEILDLVLLPLLRGYSLPST